MTSLNAKRKRPLELTVAINGALGLGGSSALIVLKLATSVIIARSLGAESFGIYILAMAVIYFFETIALLGAENTLVKFVSQFRAQADAPRLRGTMFFCFALVSMVSVLVCASLLATKGVLAQRIFDKPQLTPVLAIMALSIPLSNCLTMQLASLRGVKLIKYSVLVRQLLMPLFQLAAVILAVLLGYHLQGVAWAYVITTLFGATCGGYFLLRNFPELLQRGSTISEPRTIASFSLPLLLSAILNRIIGRVDIFLLGYYLPAQLVGIYGVAKRFLPLIQIPLGAFNNIFAPVISDLFARGEHEELRRQFQTVTKWVCTLSLPIFTLITFFSKELLSVFGPEFVAGSQAMLLLCIGQIASAGTGSTGFMLMMTGRPLANLANSAFLCVISIMLNVWMIPRFGILGAACASAFSLTMVQILRLAEVWYFLKMQPYREDVLKPIFSCLFSALILSAIIRLGVDPSQMLLLFMLFGLFLLTYAGSLRVLGLSADDYVLVNSVKERLFSTK